MMSTSQELCELISAYALRSTQPSDPIKFRQLARLGGGLGSVTTTCFLLYPNPLQSECSVRHFLFHTAPTVLRQFNRTTRPQQSTSYNRIRGKVDWSSTYKARYVKNCNPNVVVCRQNRRIFDRPENQLFKFLLHQIQNCLDSVPPLLRTCFAWGKELCAATPDSPLLIESYISTLAYRLRTLRTHAYLQDVQLPSNIQPRHIVAARTCRNEIYTLVANFSDFYQMIVNEPNWEQWHQMFNYILPLPPAISTIGQLL